jgi:hypothetical protein
VYVYHTFLKLSEDGLMNRFDKSLGHNKEAKIKYMDGEFRITSQGDFVTCAITSKPIALEQLKYWSVELQEPYVDAEAAFERHKQVKT